MKTCGYCGRSLTNEDIKEYHPDPDGDWSNDLEEEQCAFCGYHATFIETSYQQ